MLKEKIRNKESGYIFYGLTPPKINTEEEKIEQIAAKQIERLQGIKIDALVLYDIQDESSRTDSPRPFPFMPTLLPEEYSIKYLKNLQLPKIIYKSVGKYTQSELETWILNASQNIDMAVFVGSPSKKQTNTLNLNDAYFINEKTNTNLLIGGVTIPERHAKKGDEHIRLFDKTKKGCSFFISQCVYSLNNVKNFLSDYYYASLENECEMGPIIFTLTPCGSVKTLQFMEWLGIDIPKWLNNDLKHAKDILKQSVTIGQTIAQELIEYCKNKKIPYGFNIESVAIRKEEIDASIEMLKSINSYK